MKHLLHEIRHNPLGLAVLLMVAYGLGMLFSLKTHRELFASVVWPTPQLATLL